ncbi:hypothetical protein JKF63_02977 [Porcisia hertigi]|uniref:Uncharacterized protein n=1 Tax=Porcisia hertigi TaxID=2761500 RepID=A0A836I8B1_9TRYP|nr:hypothetical protein JKF63_02977 [Porcisia hertigi]
MQSERSLSDPKRQVRFSSLPPSTPLFSFDVLEWSPCDTRGSDGSLTRLHPRPSVFEHRLDSCAIVDPRETPVFGLGNRAAWKSTVGSWTCFRTLVCFGDVLVLQDSESVDVGAACLQEFTWKQGPGRLPSGGLPRASFGASADLWPTRASVSEKGVDVAADRVSRDTLLSSRQSARQRRRPRSLKREIQLQDIHSIRRYCFQKPLLLLFDVKGQLISEGDASDPSGRSSCSPWAPAQHRRHRSVGFENKANIQWRYELWGPVGIAFTLRGGRQMFLAFASVQDAQEIEKLLIRFAAGAGLMSGPQVSSSPHPIGNCTPVCCSSAPANATNDSTSSIIPRSGSLISPLASDIPQRTTSQSSANAHIGLCQVSCTESPLNLFPSPPARMVPDHSLVHTTLVTPQTGEKDSSVVSTRRSLLTRLTGSATALQGTGCALDVSTGEESSRPPGSGYLYCRPWGGTSQYRRYYLRVSTAKGRHHVVHFSRHRLRLWQILQQAFRGDQRSVSLDLRHTYVSPSAVHANVLRVASRFESCAGPQKSETPAGGVVSVGLESQFLTSRAASQRGLELSTGRPVIFEAVAKSPEERTLWLAWFRNRGATVQAADDGAEVWNSVGSQPMPVMPGGVKLVDNQTFHPTPAASQPGHEVLLAGRLVRGMPTCASSAFPDKAFHSLKPLDVISPHLPLREPSEGQRGTLQASAEAAPPLRLRNSSGKDPNRTSPNPHEILPVADEHVRREATSQPLSVTVSGAGIKEKDGEELTAVLEDYGSGGAVLHPDTASPYSPDCLVGDGSSTADCLVASPYQATASRPQVEAGRWPPGSGERAAEQPCILAPARDFSGTNHEIATTRPTATGSRFAAVYLEDTTSSDVSSSDSVNESPLLLPEATPKLPQTPPYSTGTPTLPNGITSHTKVTVSVAERGTGETSPNKPTTGQLTSGSSPSLLRVENSAPHTRAVITDGGVPSVPIQTPFIVVMAISGGTEQQQGMPSDSHSVGTPPCTFKLKSTVVTAAALDSSVAEQPHRRSQASIRSSSPDTPSGDVPPAALRSSEGNAAATHSRSSCPLQAPTTSSQGTLGLQPRHEDPTSELCRHACVMHNTPSSSSLTHPSRSRKGKCEANLDDARNSGIFPSCSAPDHGSLSLPSSVVDPQLRQLLEPYPTEKRGDHSGHPQGIYERRDETPSSLSSSPFDLHVVASKHYLGNGAVSRRVSSVASLDWSSAKSSDPLSSVLIRISPAGVEPTSAGDG